MPSSRSGDPAQLTAVPGEDCAASRWGALCGDRFPNAETIPRSIAFAKRVRPAPTGSMRGDRSSTRTSFPARRSTIAALNPPIPPPTTMIRNNGNYSEEGNRYEGQVSGGLLTFEGPARFQYGLDDEGRIELNGDGTLTVAWWLRDEGGEWTPWMRNTFTKVQG